MKLSKINRIRIVSHMDDEDGKYDVEASYTRISDEDFVCRFKSTLVDPPICKFCGNWIYDDDDHDYEYHDRDRSNSEAFNVLQERLKCKEDISIYINGKQVR